MGNGHESGGAQIVLHTVVLRRKMSSALTRGCKGVLQVVQTPVKELGERSFPKSQVRKSKNMGIYIICDIIRRDNVSLVDFGEIRGRCIRSAESFMATAPGLRDM